MARHGLKKLRKAIISPRLCHRFTHAPIGLSCMTDFEIGVVGKFSDKQIRLAVVVIIEPDRASAPLGWHNPAGSRYVRKCSVAVVVIKNAFAKSGDKDVLKTVAIIVADGDTLAI